jgi:23S rRNA (adenine1618-N6)-methyltransferase
MRDAAAAPPTAVPAGAGDADDAASLTASLESLLREHRAQLARAGPDEEASGVAAALREAVAEAEAALAALRGEASEAASDPTHRPHSKNKRPRPEEQDDEDEQRQQQQPRATTTTYQARGPYRSRPSEFGALAEAHPPLRPFLVVGGSGGGGGKKQQQKQRRRPTLDFTSWPATRELTAATLSSEYGVRGWRLPAGRLVPPVPNREAYLCWVADLLALAPPPTQRTHAAAAAAADAAGNNSNNNNPQQQQQQLQIHGLDIGCGASLIYCLLGAAGWGWRMRGVDADAPALEAAAANARAASEAAPALGPLLELGQADPADLAAVAAVLSKPGARWSDVPGGDGVLARALRAEEWAWRSGRGDEEGGEGDGRAAAAGAASPPPPSPPPPSFAFCVCNPPFFESGDEAGRNPRTACGGTAHEMVCPGGEAAFVASIVADSVAVAAAVLEEEAEGREGGGGGGSGRRQAPFPSVHWFSTMVGKKATLKAARAALHELMRPALPDEPVRARVTAVRTTALAPGGGGGGGGGGGKASGAASPTTRWCIAWTFAPDARRSEGEPLPLRDPSLADAGPWLLRRENKSS